MSNEKMRTAEAAAYLGKSVSWLNQSRLTGTGPAYLKIGGGVFYTKADLDAYLAGTRRTAVYDHREEARFLRSLGLEVAA